MNSEFEKKLSEQPMRAPPAAWRAEILRDARTAAAEQSLASSAATGWRSWLWPAPQAWAALAACWLALLAVNCLDRVPQDAMVTQIDTARLALALAEKRHALLELEVAVVTPSSRPATLRAPPGSSGWIREAKGELPC